MKTKAILFALSVLILLTCCTRKPKQSLPDELPKQDASEYVLLNTSISPPPPGKTDISDTTSIITPEKMSASEKIYNVTEVDFLPAYPKSGWSAFSAYLQSVLYPKEVKDKNVEGYLSISFVVEKDGSVSNIEIIKSVDKAVDNEITKALQNMPAWKPGKKEGLYVRSKYGFTLVYSISNA